MKNRNFDFSWQFGNFGIRTMHQCYEDKKSPLNKNAPIELVKYLDEGHKQCYVVAWFRLTSEGYELHFVGNRPMKDIGPDEMKDIWSQLQAAQKMLDVYFEACEE